MSEQLGSFPAALGGGLVCAALWRQWVVVVQLSSLCSCWGGGVHTFPISLVGVPTPGT